MSHNHAKAPFFYTPLQQTMTIASIDTHSRVLENIKLHPLTPAEVSDHSLTSLGNHNQNICSDRTYNLPSEMLAAIFEAGIDPFSQEERSKPFEIIISHVSQRWRTIASRTPRLWTGINIYISRYLYPSLICTSNNPGHNWLIYASSTFDSG